jgi:hypothetical protein
MNKLTLALAALLPVILPATADVILSDGDFNNMSPTPIFTQDPGVVVTFQAPCATGGVGGTQGLQIQANYTNATIPAPTLTFGDGGRKRPELPAQSAQVVCGSQQLPSNHIL